MEDNSSSRSQPCADAQERSRPPHYVQEALRGLTPVQKATIIRGYIGDETMATVSALKSRAIFYLKINSPNGRCGFMELTPLGESIREILKAQALADGASSRPTGQLREDQ